MAQTRSHGRETRPAHVEDWLQTLPYANLEVTAGELAAAIEDATAADLRPSVRGQLVQLYWRAHHYLLATHIKPGSNPVLVTVDRLRRDAQALASVARALGALARLWALESVRQRGLLSPPRPPVEAMATSLRLLAHGVLLDYHGYLQVPSERWAELHRTFALAEQLGVAGDEVTDPERNAATTCRRIYLELLATAVADPYHLAPGAVWSVHGLLGRWSAALGLRAGIPAAGPRAGLFLVDLDGGQGPMQATRAGGVDGAAGQVRSFDCSPLQGRVQQTLKTLDETGPASPLPADLRQARLLLEHLARSWGLPPKRYFPRHGTSGEVQVALGMSEVYWRLNGEREFAPPLDDGATPPPQAADYPRRQWQMLDRGPGGFAICSSGSRAAPVRVGDPVAMRGNDGEWQVGLIRWLMMQPDGSCRIGVRVLAGAARPVAVRPSGGKGTFQRALLLPGAAGDRPRLIASGGLFAPGRRVELLQGELRQEHTLRSLLDATARVEEIALA